MPQPEALIEDQLDPRDCLCVCTTAGFSKEANWHHLLGGVGHGPIDGIAGSETAQALRRFQSLDKVPVSGQIDSATVQALRIG
jgi:peptidoglycan hydrolase-like protein with peptidoglycan-binding domain